MLTVLLAALGWVTVCIPGVLCAQALRPAAGRLRNLAVAPILAVGLIMMVGRVVEFLGGRVGAWTVLPLSAGLPLLAIGVRRCGGTGDRARPAPPDAPLRRSDRVSLGAAVVLGVGIWAAAIRSAAAVLPNDDGAQHGLFTQRILDSGTLRPSMITAGDPVSGTPAYHYYPLALHLTAAIVARVTGAPVNTVLTVGLVLASAVFLPLGIFVLTRRMFVSTPAAAGAAAVLSATLAWFPYQPISWGGLPLIVAMSLVPAAVDAVWRRPHDGSAVAVGLLLALLGYGVFAQHNSELVTVALFALLLSLGARRELSAPERRRLLATWAVGVVALAAMLAPQLSQLAAGADQFTPLLGATSTARSGPPLLVLFVVANPLVCLLAVTGLVLALRRGWSRGWMWCLVATLVLCASSFAGPGPLRILTTAWYSDWRRLAYLLAYFEVVYAGTGAAWLAARAASALSRIRGRVRRGAWAVALAGLAAVAGGLLVVESIATVHAAYADNSLAGADQRAAFAWLAARVGPSDRVLNQFSDGSGWMATLDGVNPTFPIKPDTVLAETPAWWGARWYLLLHAADLATDRQAATAARQWNVRYVYVNDVNFLHVPGRLSAAALQRSSAYRPVWRRGTVTIFEVVGS